MTNVSGSYFIVGIKGMAMANIAIILRSMGFEVYGSDTSEKQPTDVLLKEHSISWTSGFHPSDIPPHTTVLIYAASHNGIQNPQVQAAQERGITVLHQAHFLGNLLQQFDCSLAVCGCHGKTTTSSLLAYTLSKMGSKPSWLVGAPSFNEYWGGKYEGKNYFVIEADEYAIDPPHDSRPKLLSLVPDFALCLNIDYDHPDVYESLDVTKETFETFFKQTKKRIIACGEDKNTQDVLSRLPDEKYMTYGFNKKNDLILDEIRYDDVTSSFRVMYKNHDYGLFSISLFGEKNILNTGGVILLLFELGFTSDEIRNAVQYFVGAKRRFELITCINNTYLFDDYGHHPHELDALIQAARSRFPAKRLFVIFQPHTYTRTYQMKKEFADALSGTDIFCYIAPVFASAREPVQTNISSHDIVKAVGKKNTNLHAFDSLDAVLTAAQKEIRKGDVVFTVGAGDIYTIGRKLMKIIKEKTSSNE